jgi:hypothetical protein
MKILLWLRSIALGWVTLLVLAYMVERQVLHWMATLFGPLWIATAHLCLDSLTLAAAGWAAGRANRSHAILSGLLFALSLCFWDFGDMLALNVPWLLKLSRNTLSDSRFFDSLAASAETHVLLFGCLIAGAALSRPREKPVSIVD